MKFTTAALAALVGCCVADSTKDIKDYSNTGVSGSSISSPSSGGYNASPAPAPYLDAKCTQTHYQIHASGDLLQLSDCNTIAGSITIDGYDSEYLDLGSISHIEGNLQIWNASIIQRIEAPSLRQIDGALNLETLTSLGSASFPRLESVEAFHWKVLPIFSYIALDAGIKNITSIRLSDTSFTSFGGFNVQSLKSLRIDNNRYLERVDSSVQEITGGLLISANAPNLKVSLPELKYVRWALIQDAEKINLQNLEEVHSSAEFIENHIGDLKLTKLRSVGKTLSIIDNSQLRKLDFPVLEKVGGGLLLINNDEIKDIDFLPELKSVGGAIQIEGDIDSSELRKLRIVKGSAILKSSSKKFDCLEWANKKVGTAVRGGKIECGSGNSEFTDIISVDDTGKRTGKSSGTNTAKINKDGGIDVKESAGSESHPFAVGFVVGAVGGTILTLMYGI